MTKLTKEFSKSARLEEVLARINRAIEPIDIHRPQFPKYPLLLIFGCPRSGTTVFMQWLASLGCFGYPSNLIARFYGNPAFGCDVQKVLIDLDKENQLGLADIGVNYTSSLGRTKGALAPSEFWYYWRRFFKFDDVQRLSESELNSVDLDSFLYGLGAMEHAIGKPLVMKGMLLNWNIPLLNSISDNFIYVSIKRDLSDIAKSILLCRERYTGSREHWWSFRPPGYRQWLKLRPAEQVALQAYHTQAAVDQGMLSVHRGRSLEVSYESFCNAPQEIYEKLKTIYRRNGFVIPEKYEGAKKFNMNSNNDIDSESSRLIQLTLEKQITKK